MIYPLTHWRKTIRSQHVRHVLPILLEKRRQTPFLALLLDCYQLLRPSIAKLEHVILGIRLAPHREQPHNVALIDDAQFRVTPPHVPLEVWILCYITRRDGDRVVVLFGVAAARRWVSV